MIARTLVMRALRQRPHALRNVAAGAIQTASSFSNRSGIPKGLNTSNPFEIKFHVEHVDGRPSEADEASAGIESCFFEDEIEKFHSEMIGVFGSEPEEHSDSGDDQTTPSAIRAPAASNKSSYTTETPPIEHRSPAPPTTVIPPARPHPTLSRSPLRPPSEQAVVMLVQGPCTYVHDEWVGSKDRMSVYEVGAMVEDLAHSHGLHVVQRHSNHEGQILDWLLSTVPGDKIILNWNSRLVDSPLVYRALSSIRASVIVVAPLDAGELGPLPSSVKGVISGFGTKALELAIQACK